MKIKVYDAGEDYSGSDKFIVYFTDGVEEINNRQKKEGCVVWLVALNIFDKQ